MSAVCFTFWCSCTHAAKKCVVAASDIIIGGLGGDLFDWLIYGYGFKCIGGVDVGEPTMSKFDGVCLQVAYFR
jgi:hypothetical protein